MSPRRLALTLVVALVAATGGVGATAARASSSTICVALVIDAHTLGDGVSSSCATVSKGATGVDVLQAAGHRIQFRSDGLICAIDGLPRGGCGAVDASHYWAYFHRAPGQTSWTYSTEGPSTYQPANTATDGWVWDDGETLAPKNVPYSQICETKPTPTPTPTRIRPPHPKPKPTATPHHPFPPETSAAPGLGPTPSASTRSASSGKQHHGHRGGAQSPQNYIHVTALPVSPSTTAAALAGGADPPTQHHGGLDLLIGVVAVAALGGLAALRFRRSRP